MQLKQKEEKICRDRSPGIFLHELRIILFLMTAKLVGTSSGYFLDQRKFQTNEICMST